VRRWSVGGDPRGIAIGADGMIYVGLAEKQALIAVDPKTGAVRRELVLDSAEIAATKELVTLRTDRAGKRLYVANGSDESATILSLPDLAVIREITMEGETIRDALPDPKGRYLYLLGRRVHVFDADGQKEVRTLPFDSPMAMATSSNGNTLALMGTEDFGNAKATVAVMYDTSTFNEIARDPMQTDKTIEAALFAAADRALVAVSRDYLYEKPLVVLARAPQTMTGDGRGPMRMRIDFGDLVNSERICLPEGSGPQIATLGAAPDTLLFAERRCSAGGTFSGSSRRVAPASLYGVNAYAIAYDAQSNTLAVTERAGYLTIYKVPRAADSPR
jgi:DNA-binding beta-propeller fold protein YncE